MALMEILKYPDPRLRKKSVPVAKVTPEMGELVDNMLETMYAARGIGLAAPQVGELIRLLVIDIRPQGEGGRYEIEDLTELERQVQFPLVIFNPEIIEKDGKTTFDEGCLSVPGYFETVTRAAEIKVQGLGKDGKSFLLHTDGLLAICLQHEMDHLEGKLFIDRLSTIKSARIKARIKKHGYPDPSGGHNDDEDPSSEDVAL